MLTGRDRFMAYTKGFRDGASNHPSDPKYSISLVQAEYDQGRIDGRIAFRGASIMASERYSFEIGHSDFAIVQEALREFDPPINPVVTQTFKPRLTEDGEDYVLSAPGRSGGIGRE